jgi:hypothetical protein
LPCTPSLPKYTAYKFFLKPNNLKFDQGCRRKYQHLEYPIDTIRFIMMLIFMWYTFGITDIDNFLNIFSQTLHRLTFKKSYMHYIMGRRKYSLLQLQQKLDYSAYTLRMNCRSPSAASSSSWWVRPPSDSH